MKRLFNRHFEWIALTTGLILMAAMNPYVDNGASWCLIEMAGINFCPGEGLGHSVALLVRGNYFQAIEANMMGPLAILIISSRVFYLLHNIYLKRNDNQIIKNG